MSGAPENSTMACEQAEMLLAQSLFGELEEPDQEGRRLHHHLATCAACRERLADMRAAAGLVHEALTAEPEPKLSPARRAALQQAIEGPSPRVLVLRIPLVPLALAASIALVALTLWAAVIMIRSEPQPRPVVAYRDEPAEAGRQSHRESGIVDRQSRDAEPLVGTRSNDQIGSAQQLADAPPAGPRADAPAERMAARIESAEFDRIQPAPSAPVAAAAKLEEESPAATEALADAAAVDQPADAIAEVAAGRELRAARKAQPQVSAPSPYLPPSHLFRAIPVPGPVVTAEQAVVALALVSRRDSFELAKQYLQTGYRPPAGAVRSESFVNAVSAAGSVDAAADVAVQATLGPAPFAAGNWLLKIDIAAGVTLIDPQLRVEFNPAVVRRHRLLGYEDHRLEPTSPSGQTGRETAHERLEAGQSSTVLFELELDEPLRQAEHLAVITLEYVNAATGERRVLRTPLAELLSLQHDGADDPQFLLAAAAAAFAENLRGAGPELSRIETQLSALMKRTGEKQHAAELLQMVRQARQGSDAP